MKSLNLSKKWGLSPFLNFGKERSLWVSLLSVLIALYLLFSMISISFVQGFLTLSFICWFIILFRKEQKFTFPPFFWPLIVYTALSLVSSLFSVNPSESLKDCRDLLLFLIILIIYTGFTSEKAVKKANLALLASAYISCLYALYYFIFKALPAERIEGFMGQVMTQGGLLLLFSSMALSMFLFSRKRIRYLWGLGFLLSLIALALTLTRNAWVGLVVAVSIILFFYKPKTLILVPIVIGIFLFIGPQSLKKRALSIFSSEAISNRERIEFFHAGIKIIKDYPLLGTGPNTVEEVYQDSKYGLSERTKKNVHLHNNILQIGAERGIPTLLAWFTFMIWVFLSLIKLLKNKDPTLRPFTIAALSALCAISTAGLFEYNFHDSEITALFLYMIAIPFSLARIQKTEQQE